MIRLSRAGESISTARKAGPLNDDADTHRHAPPLSHLAALLREMHWAGLPVAEIAQQQAQRLKARHAA